MLWFCTFSQTVFLRLLSSNSADVCPIAINTHAGLLLKQGIHPEVAKERLDRSTISTTPDINRHVVPGMQEVTAKCFDDILKVSYNERVIKSS